MDKEWYKSRTMWFAFAVGAFGALQTQTPAIQELLGPSQVGWMLVAMAVIQGGLRAVTTQGITT